MRSNLTQHRGNYGGAPSIFRRGCGVSLLGAGLADVCAWVRWSWSDQCAGCRLLWGFETSRCRGRRICVLLFRSDAEDLSEGAEPDGAGGTQQGNKSQSTKNKSQSTQLGSSSTPTSAEKYWKAEQNQWIQASSGGFFSYSAPRIRDVMPLQPRDSISALHLCLYPPWLESLCTSRSAPSMACGSCDLHPKSRKLPAQRRTLTDA